MDVTLLRTLTRKSFLKFGKYYDLTVQGVINMYNEKGLNYLTWIYFNSSKINFTDDILNELCIKRDDRIVKPSKIPDKQIARDLLKKCINLRIDKDLEQLGMIKFWKKSTHLKAFTKHSENAQSINNQIIIRQTNNNKDLLRRINQGVNKN